ncbi:thiolase family protein [Aneurinibacillus migulanus]|uniref:Acetyl-CoA acetyltransferase n=1 Tax=Aneurinibacillus migulanus TaxID=47500 RepID=A0A0D1YIL3_ANEMI|nr:thiolase family protein [Aneurinibacillus migulanus]KIV58597.1 acetyl-CoA acetyltransferase [Aneurinibacillus migulanus]KON96280.1 acetyl-CoA acetyltransferase [Aneurinibacillus migulanus]MED0892194.1 thiolase family protein [Aneurinibacillus migulanus]MED1615854.1 thiolase family protein [Aneurinibacillus migulanus]SDI26209.1 acetyl-CoA acetyltransferases [Aneurinibacillus migulanus]
MREAVIVEAVRTPIGRRGGILSTVRPDDLAAEVLRELIVRSGISSELVEDVIMGCVSQSGEQAGDIARVAALLADYPIEVPGVTIDRQCGSSQQAVHFAAQAIISGDMDVVVAAGVESMTRVPMFSNLQGAEWNSKLTARFGAFNQGISAERMAEKWGLTRRQMDEFALESHQKAVKAQKEGWFEREIMPIILSHSDGTQMRVQQDEGPRRETTLEKLGALKPAFLESGSIHAGNASQISDGAAGLLLMSRNKAEELGLKPRFRIVARSVVGSDPRLMLTGPIAATRKVLQKAGLTLEQMDIYEVNEAFACVPLVWLAETGADPARLNPNGGAIALGHPLGASGARVMVTLLHELERTGGRYGLQAICEGHGMANATIVERLDR